MMTRDIRQSTMLVVSVIAATFFVTSCAKRPTIAAASISTPTSAPAPPATPPTARNEASVAERVASVPSSPRRDTSRPPVSDFHAQPALQDIHFDFDKYDIRAQDAATLDENARWLNNHASDLVLIEGHADERGTNEYNLALGERRAKATMSYLVSRGVRAERIAVISYGEERPLCIEHETTCWAKNRRAHVMVNAR